jgi:hemolysin activation/secretion protein
MSFIKYSSFVKYSYYAALFYSGALCLSLHAENTIDAGSIQRQTEQDLNLKSPPAAIKRREPAPAPQVQSGAVTVSVNRYIFAGNTLLNDVQLQAAVSTYLNRELTFAELQLAADAIAAAYRDAGWVARAYFPKQEIEQGVVTVQIVEAVFGTAHVDGKQPERIAASRLVAMVNAAQAAGKPLSAHQVDRALLLLDDLPGVSVSGNLSEGKGNAETDLSLLVRDDPLFAGSLTLDRNGAVSTGRERLSANIAINSPLRLGDLLATNFMKTQGSDYARAAYSLPAGNAGTRVGMHLSALNYRLLGTFGALHAQGSATNGGLDFSYPLIRSQLQNLNLSATYDQKWFDNTDTSGTAPRYQISAGSISLGGNRFDTFGGGGTNLFILSLTHGNVNLNGSPNQTPDAQTTRTAGDYTKINLFVSRQQALTRDMSLNILLSAQASNKNLDSSEKIYLGGANGVRAFPASEAGGSSGQTLTLELRRRIAGQWMLTGFYDYGRIQQYQTNLNVAGTALTPLNNYALSGFGASLGWQGPNGIDVQATISRRSHNNPAANISSGTDADGTKILNRIWMTASKAF